MIHRDSVTVRGALSFRAPRSFSLTKNEAIRPPRFHSDSNAVQTVHATNGLAQERYGSTPRRSNSASIASKTISAGIAARLVQRMITARAAIRYSVMQALLPMRDHGVADVLRTILLIPDPFRRQLRVPCATAATVYLSIPPGERRPIHRP